MTIDVRVTRITYRAHGIHSFELVRPDGGVLPAFSAGAHIDVRLPNGMSRPYSLCNRPGMSTRYEIAVQREGSGSGGSRYMHDMVRVGDILTIAPPINHFALVEDARRHLLIGGGIGITPIIAMAHCLNDLGADYALHYCVRSEDQLAFRSDVEALGRGAQTFFHVDGGDPSRGLDIAGLLGAEPPGTHVYCCGPASLLTAVRQSTAAWAPDTVHFESFASPVLPAAEAAASETEIEVSSTGHIVKVQHDESVLDALRRSGVVVESSCEAGTCGECRTRILAGEADHNDFVLTEDEQRDWMMVCVSRPKSNRLKLDL